MINGMYRQGYMSDVADFNDLYGCGCESQASASGGFDFASIPIWVWIGALAVGAMMVMKKGR